MTIRRIALKCNWSASCVALTTSQPTFHVLIFQACSDDAVISGITAPDLFFKMQVCSDRASPRLLSMISRDSLVKASINSAPKITPR